MKIVLFLGAGFSKAFGLPLMKEFYQEAIAGDVLSEEERKLLREMRRRVRQGYTWPTIFRRDIEPLLRSQEEA